MSRTLNRLSHRKVETLRETGMHPDGGGLYLQVTEGSAAAIRKSWVYRYSSAGRERQMGLGAVNAVPLAEAREQAAAARALRRSGKDPIDERDVSRARAASASAKSMSFDECAAAYIAAHRNGWRNIKHAAQWTSTIGTYCSPVFGRLPVTSIDVNLVMKAIEPIWGTKPETASRVRGRIERILDWAKVRGLRDGENPARWRGNLHHLLPVKNAKQRVKHHPAMAYVDLPAFMKQLGSRDAVAARALGFAILTAARTGEVLGATWAEIDLRGGLWTIPAERMKASREHRVPLSGPATSILKQMQSTRLNDHVFPGETKAALSNMSLLMLLRRMGCIGVTAHGFRSTFRDWAEEQTDTARSVVELCLAHSIGNAVEAAYRRTDLLEKRRLLMEKWADFCGSEPQLEP